MAYKSEEMHPDYDVKELLEEVDDPTMRSILDKMYKSSIEKRSQAMKEFKDPTYALRSDIMTITAQQMASYPSSPTAKTWLKAWWKFYEGTNIIAQYLDKETLNMTDCEMLKPGLYAYSEGYFLEQFLANQFPLPVLETGKLIDKVLQCYPDDITIKYLRVKNVVGKRTIGGTRSYEDTGADIFALALLADEIEQTKQQNGLNPTQICVLKSLYEHLAPLFACTDQDDRALNAFEKSYELDPSDPEPLYGIAYQHIFIDANKNLSKGISLLHQYLDEAPSCTRKYPNAHYLLAWGYFVQHQMMKAIRQYKLGQEFEKKRLSFLPPVGALPFKTSVESFLPLELKLCNNPECQIPTEEQRRLELKKCTRCKSAHYCSRECQQADWGYHKKLCKKTAMELKQM